jgi:hypothetical protein
MAKGQGRKIENGFVPARKNRIVVCEDCNFIWDEPELEEIVQMCKEGVSIWDIGKQFDRDPDEVLFAIVHLGREERL